MLHVERCLGCNQPLDPLSPRSRDGDFNTAGPWPTLFSTQSITCLGCKTKMSGYETTIEVGRTAVWNSKNQVMAKGSEYDHAYNFPDFAYNQRSPLKAYWAWHPMTGSTTADDLISTSFRNNADGVFDTGSSLLILPATATPAFIESQAGMFSEVMVLKPAMTSDAIGPYPSFKAENAIIRTLAARNVLSITHFWPSASFHPIDYRRLGLDPALLTMWNNYYRSNIPVLVPQ